MAVDVTGSVDGDLDFFAVQLEPGDILGAAITGGGTSLTFQDGSGLELIGSDQDLTGVHPANSPLPGGNAALSMVVDTSGTYYVGVDGGSGAYTLNLRVFRPALEQAFEGEHQTLFVDFDGASIDMSIFLGQSGIADLSPLNSFLPGWGLTGADENAVIDAILASIDESLSGDMRTLGNNGDFDATGIHGQFDIEILNSRDHADPFGLPNVSRVIIGGSIDELGFSTIGIAQSIDVGNFDTSETAVLLLDVLSDSTGPINQIVLDPSVTIIDLIGVAVGNIAAHEAGHFFGAWHTDPSNASPNIMDQGGNFNGTVGVGADGMFGTLDDVDVDFGDDVYVPNEGFTGLEDTLNSIAFGLSTGTAEAELIGPTVLTIDPPARTDRQPWYFGFDRNILRGDHDGIRQRSGQLRIARSGRQRHLRWRAR